MKKKFLGFLLCGAVIVSLTGCGNDKKNSEENGEAKSGSKTETKKTYSIKENETFYFKVNGKTFKAGDKVTDLSKADLKLKPKYEDESIPKNRYLMSKPVIDKDEKEVFDIIPINLTDDKIVAKEATIAGIEIGDYNTSKVSEETLALDFEVVGGLKLGSSYEDMVKVLGEDYYKTEFEAKESPVKMPAYTVYKYSSGYKGYEFIIDDSGKVSEIKWNNYSYDEK